MTTPEFKSETIQEPIPQKAPEHEAPKEIPIVEEKGATHTPGQIATQVAANAAQPVQPNAPTQVITVSVPATPQQLQDWSKGEPENALTWLAFYWLRMIKKALLHGYRVVAQGGDDQQYA